jgi:phosphatidylglycerophosphate synthase
MARTTTATTVLTVPNLVSTSRVALAIGFLFSDAVPTRLLLIGVASLSDFLDGWLARRTKATSRIGALVDPVADRFFALCVLVAYVMDGQLRPWQAGALFFRDVMTLIGWFVARNVSWLRPITFKARLVGKVVTVLQLVTFLAVLLVPATVDTLVLIVAALGVIATVDYTLMLWRERVRVPVAGGPAE